MSDVRTTGNRKQTREREACLFSGNTVLGHKSTTSQTLCHKAPSLEMIHLLLCKLHPKANSSDSRGDSSAAGILGGVWEEAAGTWSAFRSSLGPPCPQGSRMAHGSTSSARVSEGQHGHALHSRRGSWGFCEKDPSPRGTCTAEGMETGVPLWGPRPSHQAGVRDMCTEQVWAPAVGKTRRGLNLL